jgi:hypothetical protein
MILKLYYRTERHGEERETGIGTGKRHPHIFEYLLGDSRITAGKILDVTIKVPGVATISAIFQYRLTELQREAITVNTLVGANVVWKRISAMISMMKIYCLDFLQLETFLCILLFCNSNIL